MNLQQKGVVVMLFFGLILIAACSQSVKTPEIQLEPEEFGGPGDEEVGSFTITFIHELNAGPTTVKCDTFNSIWMQFFSDKPKYQPEFEAVQDIQCEAVVFRAGTGGTGTTTAVVPATLTYHGVFKPAPDCSLTIQIDEALLLSKVTVLHDSALGDIATDGLGIDEFTSFPAHTFMMPDEMQTIPGSVVFSVTPSDYVIPAFTGCTYTH